MDDLTNKNIYLVVENTIEDGVQIRAFDSEFIAKRISSTGLGRVVAATINAFFPNEINEMQKEAEDRLENAKKAAIKAEEDAVKVRAVVERFNGKQP